MDDLRIRPGLSIPGSCLSWTATRASGPGGQHVNRVATKIDLRFDLEGCELLSSAVKARLRTLTRGRRDLEGRVMVISQASRSRDSNLQDAREKLAALIREALIPPRARRATRPTRGSVRRRLEAKGQRAQVKASRGRIKRDD